MDRVADVAGQSPVVGELAVAAVMEGGDKTAAAEESPPGDVFLPAKLLNNAAALHLRGGEKGAAMDLMYEAIEARTRLSLATVPSRICFLNGWAECGEETLGAGIWEAGAKGTRAEVNR